MKNLPQTETDTKTKQLLRGAIAGIDFHAHNSLAAVWDQSKVEEELELYYKQLEALDSPKAATLTVDEKKSLRGYYQKQIRQRLTRLSILIKGTPLTARAINCNVVQPEIVS